MRVRGLMPGVVGKPLDGPGFRGDKELLGRSLVLRLRFPDGLSGSTGEDVVSFASPVVGTGALAREEVMCERIESSTKFLTSPSNLPNDLIISHGGQNHLYDDLVLERKADLDMPIHSL